MKAIEKNKVKKQKFKKLFKRLSEIKEENRKQDEYYKQQDRQDFERAFNS